MLTVMKRFVREEEGASMVEYGLLLALIAVVLIGTLTTLGEGIQGMFSTVADEM